MERENEPSYQVDVTPVCHSDSPPESPELVPLSPKPENVLEFGGFEYTEALPVPKELENLEMPFVEMQ